LKAAPQEALVEILIRCTSTNAISDRLRP